MNVRLFGVVAAMSVVGLVACGDDTGGTGTGSGGSSGTGTGGAASSSTGGDTTATTSGGTGGDDTTTAATTGGTGGGGTGGGETTACGDLCADDAGCDEDPPNPGTECGDCVQAEADQGAASACAAEGALGDCCQDNDDCSTYVSCVLGGGSQEECATDNEAGAERARVCVLSACGGCGTPE